MANQLLCVPPEGLDFYSWYDAYLQCAGSCENLSSPNNRLCWSSCGNAVFPCSLFESPGVGVDTVYMQKCDDSDFYNDFNNAVNNKAMSVFLASVMAGILAVRAVIKIIKGAVR